MIDMVKKDILPAISGYIGILSGNALAVKSVCGASCTYEMNTVGRLSALSDSICKKISEFESTLDNIKEYSDKLEIAMMYKNLIIPAMESIRADVDEAESITSAKYWPYPSYGDLLFSVQ